MKTRNAVPMLLPLIGLLPLSTQIADAAPSPRQGSYLVEEHDSPDTRSDPTAGEGPVRLARFSYIHGNVSWRATDSDEWSSGTVNLPMRQGSQIWVNEGGRAEIQFDDGSYLRLGNGAVVTFQTLYSDADGEFTEIKMNEGLATLRVRSGKSIYQLDTPFVSVKSAGPSRVRVGIDNRVEIAVQQGSATIEGESGKTILDPGTYIDLAASNSPYEVHSLPNPDSWERWNESRDRIQDPAIYAQHLPSEIALVSGDLNDYGTWRTDEHYGTVWCPRVSDPGWRPYHNGHWVWVDPFGWTWVGSEEWGWAPYHYGSWIHESYGWAWAPGPQRQYWCPAVVNFCEYNGSVAWAPLAPSEVHYPAALSIDYNGGDWSVSFSIGGAACYYPSGPTYCEPRPWRNITINRTVVVNNTYINHTTINNIVINRNTYLGRPFVPVNARVAAGVSAASVVAFGGRGEYRAVSTNAASFFVHGRSIGAPRAGQPPVAGPIAPRLTAIARTPSRTFQPGLHPNPAIAHRLTFRPPVVARAVPPGAPANHVAGHPIVRGPIAVAPQHPGAPGARPGVPPIHSGEHRPPITPAHPNPILAGTTRQPAERRPNPTARPVARAVTPVRPRVEPAVRATPQRPVVVRQPIVRKPEVRRPTVIGPARASAIAARQTMEEMRRRPTVTPAPRVERPTAVAPNRGYRYAEKAPVENRAPRRVVAQPRPVQAPRPPQRAAVVQRPAPPRMVARRPAPQPRPAPQRPAPQRPAPPRGHDDRKDDRKP